MPFLSINETSEHLANFNHRYVLGKDKCQGSERFLRIKIPNGRLNAAQFRAIAELSQTYGRGYAEITDRQNIQLHWIDPKNAQAIFIRLNEIGFSTDHGGQGIPAAQKGDVRAIISCPVAGLDKHELADAMPIVRQLDSYFDGNPDFLDMPRKFKISINCCSQNCGNPEVQDISFTAVKQPSGEVGFMVYVGGTIAAVPQLARPLGVIVKQEDILDVARCDAELFRDCGTREVKAKARFRYLVDSLGTEKLREQLEVKLGRKLQTCTDGGLTGEHSEHTGVQPQKQTGYSYVNVPIVSGELSSQKMVELAAFAEEYGDGTMCLTSFQNVIIANIPDASVKAAESSLREIGYPIVGPYLKWSTIACAGNFCGKTLDHPKNRAKEAIQYLQERFGDRIASLKLNLAFSGCPNGCARHLIADVGFQGTALAVEGKSVPAYNLYIRENSQRPLLGRLVQRNIPAEKAKYALANLVEVYLANQKSAELSKFYKNKSTEELQSIIKRDC